MKRRDFLKSIAGVSIGTGVVKAKEKVYPAPVIKKSSETPYSSEANYLNELRKFQIMMAERMANPVEN